jgi:hypothetical protein
MISHPSRRTVAGIALLSCLGLAVILTGDLGAQGAGQANITIHAPFWRIGGGFDTTLAINNSQPHAIEVEPVVYDSSGERITAEKVQLEPLQSVDISLSGLIGKRSGFGRVSLRFAGQPLDLAAQALVSHQNGKLFFNGGFALKEASKSTTIEGVSALGGASQQSHIAVSNIGDETRKLEMRLRLAGSGFAQSLNLGPHQTRLLSLSDMGAPAAALGRAGNSGDGPRRGCVNAKRAHGLH